MFVRVLHGDSDETLFNTNCKSISLLLDIKRKCCTDDYEIDLSDIDGNVKHLLESPQSYANEVLKERETLILLRAERNDVGIYRYSPLLNSNDTLTNTFLERISSKDRKEFKPKLHPAKSLTKKHRADSKSRVDRNGSPRNVRSSDKTKRGMSFHNR